MTFGLSDVNLVQEPDFLFKRRFSHRRIMASVQAALDRMPDDALERGCRAFEGAGRSDWRFCFLAHAMPPERKAGGRMDSWGPVEARLAVLDWCRDMGLSEDDMNNLANAFDLYRDELAALLSARLCRPVGQPAPTPAPATSKYTTNEDLQRAIADLKEKRLLSSPGWSVPQPLGWGGEPEGGWTKIGPDVSISWSAT